MKLETYEKDTIEKLIDDVRVARKNYYIEFCDEYVTDSPCDYSILFLALSKLIESYEKGVGV